MRILIASPQYQPELGGLTTLWSSAATALAERGHEVTVVTQQSRRLGANETEELDKVHVHRFTERLGGEQFGYAPSLKDWVRAHAQEFDILDVASYHAPLALALSSLNALPMVFSPAYHGGGHTRVARAAHVVYRPLANRIFTHARLIHCLSQSEADHVTTDHPDVKAKLRIIPPAFAPTSQGTVTPFEVNGRVLLVAGRLDPYKRVDLVLDALVALPNDIRLVICGEGNAKDALEQRARSLQVSDRVTFAGYVSDTDLRRWQRTADVAISVSNHESFGLVLAEAAAAGAQLVASDIPAHREVTQLFNLEASFISPKASAPELSLAIERALSIPRRGPMELLQRTWLHVAADLEEMYREAIGGQLP